MELPRSSSDIRVATACSTCSGNGGFGPRRSISDQNGRASFQPCSSCEGSGWKLTALPEVKPAMAERIRSKLEPIPPDPDSAFDRQCTVDHIKRSLTGQRIQVVTFCGIEPKSIDLVVGYKNQIIRILPEFRSGKFHNLTTHFVPEPYVPPEPTTENETTP